MGSPGLREQGGEQGRQRGNGKSKVNIDVNKRATEPPEKGKRKGEQK